jgi:hypothetical protein
VNETVYIYAWRLMSGRRTGGDYYGDAIVMVTHLNYCRICTLVFAAERMQVGKCKSCSLEGKWRMIAMYD